MLQLSQSSTFKKDFEYFKSKIDEITSVQVKNDLKLLLDKLVSEVKNLDQLHTELSVTNKLPIGTTDTRNSLNSIRQEIIKKLKDWEESIK